MTNQKEVRMAAWEYLELIIEGHNGSLGAAHNMLVTTSDGRFQNAKMPTNVKGVMDQIGADGWELVVAQGGSRGLGGLGAWFKRPR
jgi:hypothetical protein